LGHTVWHQNVLIWGFKNLPGYFIEASNDVTQNKTRSVIKTKHIQKTLRIITIATTYYGFTLWITHFQPRYGKKI